MGWIATTKALRRLQDRQEELRDKVSDLERAKRKLELEFTELYDKVSHQMSRMAKRYAARDPIKQIVEDEPVIGEPVIGSDPISQSIMLRRAGRG